MKKPSVILFSCINNVLLAPMIQECLSADIQIEAVFMDGELSIRDQQNVAKRLEPGFAPKPFSDFNFPEVPFYFVKDHNSANVVNKIKTMKSRYLINAGTPRILKQSILTVQKGVLNCHPGILPKYRGCSCVEWAIFNGDPVGATVHFMSEGIDQGPIVLSSVMEIKPYQSYETIRTRMIDFMSQLMVQGIKECYLNDLSPENLAPQSQGSYFKPISDEQIKVVIEKLKSGNYQNSIKT